jgi:hypothetical protein
MARLSNLKRIIKEDFPDEYQELIDKLAYSLNPFLEQISEAFNKNINNDNLAREFVTITVENSTGNLKIPVQVKTSLRSRVVGLNVIRVENLTNSSIYPTNNPFVAWTINNNILTVQKVTGIQDNNKYRLTLEIIS